MTKVAVLLLILALPAAATPPRRTYVHPTCGYSFQVPPGFVVKATTGDPRTNCEVQVRPGHDSDESVIWIDSAEGNFEAGVEGTNFAKVTVFFLGNSKEPLPPLGIYVANQPDGSWKEATHIQRGSLSGLRINDLELDCTDGGRIKAPRAHCPGDVAFLGSGHRYANVIGPVKSAAFGSVLRSLSIPLPKMKTYVHPRCRYSFRHPASWDVTPGEDDGCEVNLRPADFEKRMADDNDVDHFTITVSAGEGDFDAAAQEAGLHRVTDETAEGYGGKLKVGSWIAFGRGSAIERANAFSVGSLSGLRVDHLSVGCYREHGGYAGLCGEVLAFLTDGKRYVTVGGPPSLAYEDVMGSLHLLP